MTLVLIVGGGAASSASVDVLTRAVQVAHHGKAAFEPPFSFSEVSKKMLLEVVSGLSTALGIPRQ
jgi:hypothetical protein